jgi:hypothetical protein
MSVIKSNEFMENLLKELVDKKGITESTAKLYVKNLYTLNEGPYKNFTFLKNTDSIMEKLSKYAEGTKKTFLASIVSILNLKPSTTYKKAIAYYTELMNEKAKEHREKEDSHEKTERQEKSWMEWDEVLEKKNQLKEEAKKFWNNKIITERQYNRLLDLVVLSLYTDIPPRRNEYQDMDLVSSFNSLLPTDRNYLDWTNKKLIFLKYKTAKTYAKQEIDISDNTELLETLTAYLKHHPLLPNGKMSKNASVPLLVYADGKPFEKVNCITRILNRIFGKSVGSSMLRHIYLSSKYGGLVSEQKEDADAMGHSLGEQKDYIKK